MKTDFAVHLDGNRLQPEEAAAILGIRVFQTRSGASAFEVIVSDPELKWQSKPTFTDCKEVKIELGVTGKLKKVFDGEVTAWRTELERSGPSVLVLRGLDRSHRLMRAKKTKTYANATPIDCAKQIAADYGLTAKTRAGSPAPVKMFRFQANQTDFEFLRAMAELEGYLFFIDGSELHFGRPQIPSTDDVEFTFGEDVKTFLPKANFRKPAGVVEVGAWDTSGKSELTGKAKTGDELWSVPGVKPGAKLAKFTSSKPEMSLVESQVGTQEHADTVAKAALTRRAMEFITAEVEVQGNPVIRPGALVNIKKVGPFSGHYLVTEANHFYDAAGYNCVFYVARDKWGNSSTMQQQTAARQQAAQAAQAAQAQAAQQARARQQAQAATAQQGTQRDLPAVLSFQLLSEFGVQPLGGYEFTISGHGLSISGRTDSTGCFEQQPVHGGEYELTVGDASFTLPAVADLGARHTIHVPHHALPEHREEREPTEEERAEQNVAPQEEAEAEAAEQGYLEFILCSEMGAGPLARYRVRIEGHGLQVEGLTDSNGRYRHGPVDGGEYNLQVGDCSFSLPAIADESPPHKVHVPHGGLPEHRDEWREPTEEEKAAQTVVEEPGEGASEPGAPEEEVQGFFDVVLRSEMGLGVLAGRSFELEGHGLRVQGQTDSSGRYRHGPVEAGDYDLKIGEGRFCIATVAAGDPSISVCIPNATLPDVRHAWEGPTQEERDESKTEDPRGDP